MSTSVPPQHPAVVLRSHYKHVRALLAVAMIAVVALSATVVLVATDDDQAGTGASAPLTADPAGSTRFDGGPEEGTRGIVAPQPPPVRFEGIQERTGPAQPQPLRSQLSESSAPSSRYDGGPDEGTRGLGH